GVEHERVIDDAIGDGVGACNHVVNCNVAYKRVLTDEIVAADGRGIDLKSSPALIVADKRLRDLPAANLVKSDGGAIFGVGDDGPDDGAIGTKGQAAAAGQHHVNVFQRKTSSSRSNGDCIGNAEHGQF